MTVQRCETVPQWPLRIVTPSEFESIVEALPDGQWRLLAEVAIGGGLRWGELVPPDTVTAGSVQMDRLSEHDSRGIAGRAGLPTIALRLHADRIIGRMTASADTVCRSLAQEGRIAGRRRVHAQTGEHGLLDRVRHADDHAPHRLHRVAERRAGILRIVLSLAGAPLALLFAQLLFPAGIQRRIAERLARLLHTHAVLARAVAEPSRGREAWIHGADRKAASATARLEAACTRLRRKAGSPGEQISRIGETGRAARRLRDRLTSPACFAAVPVGPIATAARKVADQLDQDADEVLAFPDPGSAPPQAEAEIREQRSPKPSGRRRAGLVGHIVPDATSAEPAGAAGTRDMASGLIADAERLSELSRVTVTGRAVGD